MTTAELSEEIVQALHDAACSGEVAEVFVLYRGADGQWNAAVSSDDLAHLADVGQQTLAYIEKPSRGFTVN